MDNNNNNNNLGKKRSKAKEKEILNNNKNTKNSQNLSLISLPLVESHDIQKSISVTSYSVLSKDHKTNLINIVENLYELYEKAIKSAKYEVNMKSNVIDQNSPQYNESLDKFKKTLSNCIQIYDLNNIKFIYHKFGLPMSNSSFAEKFIVRLNNLFENECILSLHKIVLYKKINKKLLVDAINYIFSSSTVEINKAFKINMLLSIRNVFNLITPAKTYNSLLEINKFELCTNFLSTNSGNERNYVKKILTSKASLSAFLKLINLANENVKVYKSNEIKDAILSCMNGEIKFYKAPMPDFYYGITLYNKSILLNDEYLNDDLNNNPLYKCITVSTIMHDMAHVLYRKLSILTISTLLTSLIVKT